jgi:hypothetical protein
MFQPRQPPVERVITAWDVTEKPHHYCHALEWLLPYSPCRLAWYPWLAR